MSGPTYGRYAQLSVQQRLDLLGGCQIRDRNGKRIDSQMDALGACPADVTAVVAAGGADVAEVAITVRDSSGNAIAKPQILDVWLSDATTGAGLTGTAASGTVQAKSDSGADLQAVTAKKHLRVQTLATGVYTLEITDSGNTAFKVCAAHPLTGQTIVLATLATASYGT